MLKYLYVFGALITFSACITFLWLEVYVSAACEFVATIGFLFTAWIRWRRIDVDS